MSAQDMGMGETGDAAAPPDASQPMPDLVQLCSPATCGGCCQGSYCEAGTSSGACGRAGAQCQACAGLDSCLPDRTCGLSSSKLWTLTIVGASVYSTAPDGSAWDFPSGAPDPFLQVDGLYKSATVQDTFAPNWNYTISATTDSLLMGGHTVAMYDEDVSVNDVIAVSRAIRVTEADLRKGSFQWTDWGRVSSIRFTVAPQ